MFGRHARMERAGPRGKVKPGELAFTLSAADLFYAAGFLFAKTNDPVWRDRAVGLAERFARLRDPKTGLGPAVLDAHDPTFDRKTHQLSLGHLGVTVRNLLIDYGRRSDSYALGQLYLAQTLPPEPADRFREWALQDLLAYSQYCYDETSRAFYEMRRTDTAKRIAFSQMRVFPTLAAGHYFSYPMPVPGEQGASSAVPGLRPRLQDDARQASDGNGGKMSGHPQDHPWQTGNTCRPARRLAQIRLCRLLDSRTSRSP